MLGQLVNDYLLDFDIFHVSHVTELMHYIDTKVNLGSYRTKPGQTYPRQDISLTDLT